MGLSRKYIAGEGARRYVAVATFASLSASDNLWTRTMKSNVSSWVATASTAEVQVITTPPIGLCGIRWDIHKGTTLMFRREFGLGHADQQSWQVTDGSTNRKGDFRNQVQSGSNQSYGVRWQEISGGSDERITGFTATLYVVLQ